MAQIQNRRLPTLLALAASLLGRPLGRRMGRKLPRAGDLPVLVCAGEEVPSLEAIRAAVRRLESAAPYRLPAVFRYLNMVVVGDYPDAMHGVFDVVWHTCRLDRTRLQREPALLTAGYLIHAAIIARCHRIGVSRVPAKRARATALAGRVAKAVWSAETDPRGEVDLATRGRTTP